MPGQFQQALYSQLTQQAEGEPTGMMPVVSHAPNQEGTTFSQAQQAQQGAPTGNFNPPFTGPSAIDEAEMSKLPTQEEAAAAVVARKAADRKATVDDIELRTAKTNLELATQRLNEATSPAAQKAAELKLAEAELNLKIAELKLAKEQDPNLNPKAIAEYENKLAIERDKIKQASDKALQDDRIAFEWDKLEEEINARRAETEDSQDFTAEQNKLNREAALANTKVQASTQLRGQEIQRISDVDKFNMDAYANAIRKGEVSADIAFKKLSADISQRRLSSEILKNTGDAIAPFAPHLSSYKKGDIPLGFESGGPFEVAMRQGGAQSYDPSKYAANPVGVDLFGMAKGQGAQPVNTPMPSTSTIPDLNVGEAPTATQLPPHLQMTPEETATMQKDLMARLMNQQAQPQQVR